MGRWAFYELICFVFPLFPPLALLCRLFTLPLLESWPRTIFSIHSHCCETKRRKLSLDCCLANTKKSAFLFFYLFIFLYIMNWVILIAYWWCNFSFAIDLFVKVFVLLFINAHSDSTNDVFSMFEPAKSVNSQRTKQCKIVNGTIVDSFAKYLCFSVTWRLTHITL